MTIKKGERKITPRSLKSLPDLLLRQIAADEDDAARRASPFFHRALVVAVGNHVHALKDEPLVVVLEEDALAAQDARPPSPRGPAPREELVRVERLVSRQRHRLHVFVVIVLQAAVGVPVVVMIMVIMIVLMSW
jgi:hypothetical protein